MLAFSLMAKTWRACFCGPARLLYEYLLHLPLARDDADLAVADELDYHRVEGGELEVDPVVLVGALTHVWADAVADRLTVDDRRLALGDVEVVLAS